MYLFIFIINESPPPTGVGLGLFKIKFYDQQLRTKQNVRGFWASQITYMYINADTDALIKI